MCLVTYLGEFDISVTRSGADGDEGRVIGVQLVANVLDCDVAEVNGGEQEVRLEIDFFFKNNVAQSDGTRVGDGSQLTDTHASRTRYSLVFTVYNGGLGHSIIL